MQKGVFTPISHPKDGLLLVKKRKRCLTMQYKMRYIFIGLLEQASICFNVDGYLVAESCGGDVGSWGNTAV